MTRGACTGIDWAEWLGTDRVLDPYLIWADLTNFAMAGDADPRDAIPFVMETPPESGLMRQGLPRPLQRVKIPRAYLATAKGRTDGSRFFTAEVRARDIETLLRSSALVARFQLAVARAGRQPLSGMDDVDRPPTPLPPSATGHKTSATNANTVVGIIDDGCPFAHSNLSDGLGRTRVHHLWDQGANIGAKAASSAWTTPNDFPNGLEAHRGTLNDYAARFAQGDVYAALGMDRITGRHRTHGSAICHLAAGSHTPADLSYRRDPGAAVDPCNALPVVFVQLPLRTVADTTGGSIGYHVLNALHYIGARARALTTSGGHADTGRCVVNLSYGSAAGPHDGSSLVERAIADFLRRHDKVSLVVAAGNANLDAMHTELSVGPGETRSLSWMVGPDNPLESYLEIWWPPGIELRDVDVELTCVGMKNGVRAGLGSVATDRGTSPRCAVVFCNRVAQGLNGTMTLLAVRATRGADAAQAGVWQVSVTNRGSAPVRGVNVWAERNDLVLGRRRRQQSVLMKTPPARTATSTMTLASMSNIDVKQAFGVSYTTRYLVVGASRLSDGKRSEYSSTGPSRLGGRKGTDGLAPADVGSAQPGLLVAGAFDGRWTRTSGSSAAAAVVTRQLAADLERRARKASGRAPPTRPELKVITLPKADDDGWFRLER